ncbi:MAG TPA: mechanosensitive ion channel family protein [Thermoanaerobaculia bacterium]|nr:mechanosensitive ion channel family protein [Thermoanaerobaculia bacterium]
MLRCAVAAPLLTVLLLAAGIPALPAGAQGAPLEAVEELTGQGEPEEAPEEPAGDQEPTVLDRLVSGDLSDPSFWQLLGDHLVARFLEFLPNLLRALVVLAGFYLLYRLVRGVLHGVVRRTNADPSVLGIAGRLTKYVLVAFALVMAASQLGFNVGSVVAGLGILGLAVGLAAQESLSNVVAGLTILWDRPYRVGDNVTIAGTFGQVKEITLRTTRILTMERLDAILPNREIVTQKIVNHTLNPQLRLPVVLSIAYKEDTREARKVLLAAVAGHPLILEEPPPAVVVTELGASGVNLELRVWLRDPHAEREALFAMTEIAKVALDEAGIEIPFPQLTLHFAEGSAPPPGATLPEPP